MVRLHSHFCVHFRSVNARYERYITSHGQQVSNGLPEREPFAYVDTKYTEPRHRLWKRVSDSYEPFPSTDGTYICISSSDMAGKQLCISCDASYLQHPPLRLPKVDDREAVWLKRMLMQLECRT